MKWMDIVTALIVVSGFVSSHAQNRLAMLYGSPGMEYGKAGAVDRSGNYINGSLFQNTIDVDPEAEYQLAAPGAATQMALTKYDRCGHLVWANSIGGESTSEAPHGIATDADNNIYVTGYFGSGTVSGSQPANFDPRGGGTLVTQGGEDIFLAKYDSNGTYCWAFAMGNAGADTRERAWDIAVDDQGNSYVGGGFHGTMNFNPRGTALNASLPDTTAGLFIASYDHDGICRWVVVLDVKGNDVFSETYATCDLDGSGYLYVAGNFRGANVDFNPLGSSVRLSSSGQNDIFIARYSVENGNLTWVKRIGTAAQELVSPGALRCDSYGNCYFTGRLSGVNTVNFDPNGGLANVVNSSLYLVSYNQQGNLRHAAGMNSGTGDGGHRVAFDRDGYLYLTGWMNQSATFGVLTRTAFSPTADVFLAKYLPDLSVCDWVLNFGGEGASGQNIAAGLNVDPENHPLITGQLFGVNANVNPLGDEPCFLSSAGLNDCFVLKYNADGTLWENGTSAITEIRADWRLAIWPNPISDWVSVKTVGEGLCRLAVYTLLGQKVALRDYSGGVARLDCSLWPRGVYLLRLTDGNGQPLATRKIIKK